MPTFFSANNFAVLGYNYGEMAGIGSVNISNSGKKIKIYQKLKP